jgi:hypothetical protein
MRMLRRAWWALSLAMAVMAGEAIAQNPNPSFNLVNRTGRVVERAYTSPSGVNTWGPDRLGENVLPSGRSLAIRLPADGNCLYDVRIEYQGGGNDERRRVNTCTIADVVFGSGGAAPQQRATNDPSFRLVNRSGRQINEVYATAVGVNTWGTDRMGSEVVPPGATHIVRIAPDGNCVYDVRVVYADGSAAEKRRINLCTVVDLSFP